MKWYFITLFAFLLPLAIARADNVSTDADITLRLPSDDSGYTLKSGGGFNTLTLNGGDMTFTGGGSASVDIRSGGKKNLANSRNISVTCGSDESQLVIPAQNGDTVVTPSGTCGSSGGSSSGGGGSGGGGGGGGGTFAPSPTAGTVSKVTDLKQQIASIQAAIQQKLAQAGVSLGVLISKNLRLGDRNDEVKKLQVLFATDKDVYPNGLASGYFGPATMRAVQAFQKKYGLPTIGAVGPQTRAKIAEVFGSAPASAATPAPAAVSVTPSGAAIGALPSRTINQGERSDEVKLLQEVLAQDKDIYPEATVSGFYGPATTRAVQKFQLKHGLITSLTDQGSGRFGPKTKAKFEEVFGGIASSAPVSTPASASAPAAPAADAQAIQAELKAAQVKLIGEQIKLIQEKINALKQ